MRRPITSWTRFPPQSGLTLKDSRDRRQRKLRKAGVVLSTLCSLVALSILFCLLKSGFDHLMDATDFLGRDPGRDHVYWDMEFRSMDDLDGFSPEQKRITNSLGMQLALIPAGRFIQGSPSSEQTRNGDECRTGCISPGHSISACTTLR